MKRLVVGVLGLSLASCSYLQPPTYLGDKAAQDVLYLVERSQEGDLPVSKENECIYGSWDPTDSTQRRPGSDAILWRFKEVPSFQFVDHGCDGLTSGDRVYMTDNLGKLIGTPVGGNLRYSSGRFEIRDDAEFGNTADQIAEAFAEFRSRMKR